MLELLLYKGWVVRCGVIMKLLLSFLHVFESKSSYLDSAGDSFSRPGKTFICNSTQASGVALTPYMS